MTKTNSLLPIIRVGSWVRLSGSTSLPEWARGQNAVVVRAPVEHVQADPKDSESPVNFARQGKDVKFLVRVRETSQELEVTRDAFKAVATNVGDLVDVGGRGPAPEDFGPNVPPGELVYVGKDKWVDPSTGEKVEVEEEATA